MVEQLNILELFSGIGGMHFAFKRSGFNGNIKAAVDINPVANIVYEYNHPSTKIYNKNIQNITSKFIEKLHVNMILMSPPCQPFTRVGKQKDVGDNRTDALKHICNILPELNSIKYILMENVKGFEKSEARNLYIEALNKSEYYYREFILSPSELGIPNTRHRYFCLARKNTDFNFDNKLWEVLPNSKGILTLFPIKDIIDSENNFIYLSDDLLNKRFMLLDIVNGESKNSICFTKAYTHYCEGTGSVYSSLTENELSDLLSKIKELDNNSSEYLQLLKLLQLRYFTPSEILRLMCFPDEFKFPEVTTERQKYRLLGNSINVLVVTELIKLLIIY